MKKTINLALGNEEVKFIIDFTPYTIIFFEKSFDSDFFKELGNVYNYLSEEHYNFSKLVVSLLKLLYATTEGNRKSESFEDFMKGIDGRLLLNRKNIGILINEMNDLVKVSDDTPPQEEGSRE